MMKSRPEIQDKIIEIEKRYSHVLKGSLATIDVNAPRALEQVSAEEKLKTLYWVLGATFKSKLKGVNT